MRTKVVVVKEQYESSLFRFHFSQNMKEQTKWTAVCCQKSILTICVVIYLVFYLAIFVFIYWDEKRRMCTELENDKLAPEELLVEHNCQGEDFQHFNDFIIVSTDTPKHEWVASRVGEFWRNHKAINKRPVMKFAGVVADSWDGLQRLTVSKYPWQYTVPWTFVPK